MELLRLLLPVLAMALLFVGCAARTWNRPTFASPEVHPDGRVTVRFWAPQAQKVWVSGNFARGRQKMFRDDDGVWTFTTEPLAGGIYDYTFVVAGAHVPDPRNPSVKIWRTNSSMVQVPSDPPAVIDPQEVPHGVVHRHWYRAEALGVTREVLVYTPPGYDVRDPRRYPVLYLLHGSGDTPEGWTGVGQAHRIADNLLAAGRIRPMLIVMPYGHTPLETREGERWADRHRRGTRAFATDLLTEVIPLVEAAYRVADGPAERAVAGLSMGGGQALALAIGHFETFGWAGVFSAAFDTDTLDAQFARYLEATRTTGREPLRLLWIACGRNDFLFEANQRLEAFLRARRIVHTYQATEGGHAWSVWRRYLAEFLPLLFTDR